MIPAFPAPPDVFWFGTSRAGLFGRIDAPAAPARARAGVVIVEPFGIEANAAHRPLAVLAHRFVGEGCAVLRYHHAGTGDSAGWDTDPDLVPRWIEDVGTAVALLRSRAGVGDVTVVGLRFGATIAALGAARAQGAGAPDRVVLWAPVISGKSYARELKAFYRMSTPLGAPADLPGEADGAIDNVGHPVTAATLQAMSGLDLLAAPAAATPLGDVLIVGREGAAQEQALVEQLQGRGSVVEHTVVDDLAAMRLEDPEVGEIPAAAIGAITGWVARRRGAGAANEAGASPGDATAAADVRTGTAAMTTAAMTTAAMTTAAMTTAGVMTAGVMTAAELYRPGTSPRAVPAAAAGALHDTRERPVQIGPDGAVFGILTEPVAGADLSRPVLVLLSTGANPRYGAGRLHVVLARYWAALGERVLRVDLRGVGDAALPAGEVKHAYTQATVDDVGEIRDYVRAVLGHPDIVAVGTCSGAWAAYHAALGPRPPGRVVLVNQIIHDDSSWIGRTETPATALKARYELGRAMRSLEPWRKVLRGDTPVKANVVRLGRFALMRAKTLQQRALARVGVQAESQLAQDLRAIARRSIPQLHVLDEAETGLGSLRVKASAAMADLGADPAAFNVVTLAGAGHTFAPLWSQRWLLDTLTGALCPGAAPRAAVPATGEPGVATREPGVADAGGPDATGPAVGSGSVGDTAGAESEQGRLRRLQGGSPPLVRRWRSVAAFLR